jgi:hypothetical protein
MRTFLNRISEELSNNSIYRYINTFIINISQFLKRNPKYKDFRQTQKIIYSIEWKNRYLIIIYAFVIKNQINECRFNSLAGVILRYIDKLNKTVKQAILTPFYKMLVGLPSANAKKKRWVMVKKAANFNGQASARECFINNEIIMKVKPSSRSFVFKKMMNDKLLKRI